MKAKLLSRAQFFVTPWTVAHQVPQSMEFSRQEYWSGLPFPSPGDLPDPRIELGPPALQADALPSEPPGRDAFNSKCTYSSIILQTSQINRSIVGCYRVEILSSLLTSHFLMVSSSLSPFLSSPSS